jgi:cyclic nucleotide-binding protein
MDAKQETIRSTLKNHLLFNLLPETDERALELLFEVRNYQANDVLVEQDMPMEGMYIIHSGRVRLKQTVNGKRTSLGELGQEASFGEISLLSKAEWPYEVVASERVTALRLPRDKMAKLLATHPMMLELFKKHIGRLELSHRLRGFLGSAQYSAQQLAAILEEVGVKNIRKGQAVFEQGANDPRLYLHRKGGDRSYPATAPWRIGGPGSALPW